MPETTRTLKSDTLLLLTAGIWGFAFVAQRMGMEHLGPFLFNGIRFALGALVLLPLLYRKKQNREPTPRRALLGGGLLAGLAIFAGSSFQQVGIVYTTAGKAGFITGLYVILVPILGLFWKQRTGLGTWSGALLATVGLYLLSVSSNFRIQLGDLLVLISAFFWAGHVLLIGWLTRRFDSLPIAVLQFVTCSLLSLLTALFVEPLEPEAVSAAAVPIFYAGVLSVGVAYTLQVVAQKTAPPAHAAIILSLEAVFAVLGGWLVLGEVLSLRGYIGCALMLAGMILSQINLKGIPAMQTKESLE